MTVLTSVDQVLEGAVETGRLPGVVALVADRGGVTYQGAFGERELGSGQPITLDTVFWIASMTKAVTSVAAMQLVEQGKLGLDEPLGGLLPALAVPQVFEGFDQNGSPVLRPACRPITLRLLLSHTAGFGYDIWNAELKRYMEQQGIPSIGSCLRAGLTTPLIHEPGERWEYGINIDWAGQAVEAASGQTLDTYLRQHIFEPLGMASSGFILTPEMRQRKAGMHVRAEDGSLSAIPHEMPQQPEFFMGGGALYSTGPDYLQLLQMLLHEGTFNGAQILRPETVAQMGSNQIGDLEVRDLPAAIPTASRDMCLFPDMPKRWSLGYMITTEVTPGGRSAGSLAWAGLANTYYWLDPTHGVTGLILTQVLPFLDPAVLETFEGLERAVYTGLAGA